ncbi:DEAD/DEAH box helicase family protein [Jiella pelagia]|uniref:Helicase ATP-binding domain-containing protein n=1 Tax=Jiella pelagia TaxID=2986949 RepID=A0ABY7C3B1_9HYPH|nr:hypothetical protein [Jiella pelagia]WAP70082.1 hypothetical protein OH818_08085 [Jiella pelagia]
MVNWIHVGDRLREIGERSGARLNDGQCDSLWAIAERIPRHGLILADEVGLGKTRIAVAVAKAVTDCGGRVAILVPPTLGFQWQEELRHGGLPDVPPILRSDHQWRSAWAPDEHPKPWFAEPVVILSHGFTNWRIHADPHGRTALLPMLVGLARRAAGNRRAPRGFNEFADSVWSSIHCAAESIAAHCSERRDGPLWRTFIEFADMDWASARDGGHFQSGEDNRRGLHRAVGLGLGAFDLVVVDEAHKSRGGWTGLSRLLEETLVLYPRNTRRLCMSATPVEPRRGTMDTVADTSWDRRGRGSTLRHRQLRAGRPPRSSDVAR